jgi:hypothetical protein
MSDDNSQIPKSLTWFVKFPNEIIFEIFDYLSFNDIIYTFYYFNQRLENFLLENQCYFSYFEIPITTNKDFWNNIIPILRLRIQRLNLKSIDIPVSIDLFPNLKSVILSSSCGLPEEDFKLIINSDQFKRLHSFKIKQNLVYCTRDCDYLYDPYDLFQQVINNDNSLKIFEYSSRIATYRNKSFIGLKLNENLHSLILNLNQWNDLFSIIDYTPNLKYLNLELDIDKINVKLNRWNNIHQIQLKQFYLEFMENISTHYHFISVYSMILLILIISNQIIQLFSMILVYGLIQNRLKFLCHLYLIYL